MSEVVDRVLKDYYATISEKDADIFKLYDDNKRMRGLVEESLRAREELDASHRTTLLLVSSLQSELREKEVALDTYERESSEWREAAAALRALLRQPPTGLHLGLRDVVAEVERVVREKERLRQRVRHDGEERMARQNVSFESLWEAERVQRGLLEEAEAAEVTALRQRVASYTESCESHATLQQTVAQERAAAESERERLVARQELALRHAHLEHSRVQRLLEEANRAVAERQLEVDTLSRRCTDVTQRIHIVEEAASATTDLLTERCAEAEGGWRATVAAYRRVYEEKVSLSSRLQQLTEEHDRVVEALKKEKAVHGKAKKQLEREVTRADAAEATVKRLQYIEAEHSALKAKYIALADNARGGRQQIRAAREEFKGQLTEKEEALVGCEKHVLALQGQLEAAEKENRALAKRSTALEKRVSELVANAADVEEAKRAGSEAERQVAALEATIDRLREEGEQCIADAHAEHIARLSDIEETHRMALHALQEQTAAELTAARAELDASVAAHLDERQRLNEELQEWVTLVESRRQENRQLREQLTNEQTARHILETRQQSENTLLRSLLCDAAESSRVQEQRLEDVEERARLQEQIGVLEQACRKSAAVIAELREAVYCERQRAGTTASVLTTAPSHISLPGPSSQYNPI